MAIRAGLVRRFLSTSIFSSQSTAAAATATATATATNANANANNPPPVPSTTLFVSGLSKRTTTENLHEAFSKFGEVVHARVVTDRASGFSKGFGFVRYATLEEAEKGMTGMDAQFLDGWVIFAEYARPKPTP
ncbi:hypothetical protein L1049_007475 [Liquidambar formosana]|uniref:RRM domain-containing protein n=1 Tax=Liquidambar formosana TaxID=63359 RepID=A0AAP0S1V6_LIQFO